MILLLILLLLLLLLKRLCVEEEGDIFFVVQVEGKGVEELGRMVREHFGLCEKK